MKEDYKSEQALSGNFWYLTVFDALRHSIDGFGTLPLSWLRLSFMSSHKIIPLYCSQFVVLIYL